MPKGSKKAPSSRVQLRTRLRFLTIPLEIRQHIYNDLLQVMPATIFDLILTNRQIAGEAKPFLYRQPLIFDGQAELVSWLRTVDRTCLGHVVEVHFKLHDIDPAKIVGALGKRLRQAGTTTAKQSSDDNPYEEACDLEMKRLGNCFKYLPNVSRFTILPYSPTEARPPYDMLVSFADMLAETFPNLRSLTNHEELFPITFLSSFGRLTHLRFTGISTSSRIEVIRTFRSLPELVTLEICRPDFNIQDKHYETISGVSGAGRCNIADIVGSLPRLQSCTFREYALGARPSEAFNPLRKTVFETLNALQRHPHLRVLGILTNIDLLSRVQEKLESLISSSQSLRHIESYYDDMPAFEDLPRTIETIVIRLDPLSELTPSLLTDLLSGVGESRKEIPRLTEITLYVDSFPSSDRTRNIATWVREKLARQGVKLKLKLWDGPSRF